MGAHFKALDEGVLLVPLDPRYTQVGFNLISVQVCNLKGFDACQVFVFGGCSAEGRQSDLHAYDPATDSWTQLTQAQWFTYSDSVPR